MKKLQAEWTAWKSHKQPFYPLTFLPPPMIFVFSLGGSAVAGRDAEGLRQYAAALKELAASHQIYVVVGGGRIAREYIEKARAWAHRRCFAT